MRQTIILQGKGVSAGIAKDQLETLSVSMIEKIGEQNALLFKIHNMMLDDSDVPQVSPLY